MELSSWLITFALVLFITWCWERKRRQNYYASIGIPGPKPSFLLGNFLTFRTKGFKQTLQDWTNGQYGKTLCYYQGDLPIILSSDPDLVKQIHIKNFNKFSSRKLMIPLLKFPQGFNPITESEYHEWKKVRNILSPTFSAVRMKEMSPMVNMCIDRFLQKIADKKDQIVEFHSECSGLTLDTITTCAFGFDTDALNSPDQSFLDRCKEVFSSIDDIGKALRLIFIIHLINHKLCSMLIRHFKHYFMPTYRTWFLQALDQIILLRKNSTEKRKIDFLQLMLEASESGQEVNDNKLEATLEDDNNSMEQNGELNKNGITKENGYSTKTDHAVNSKDDIKLTEMEIKAQMIVFFLAGYETTSSALTLLLHTLAYAPRVQKKIQEELDELFPNKQDCKLDYISVQKLPYLDMVIKESLRYHVIGEIGRIRECVEPCTINGIPFKKGTCFQAGVYAIHHNPEHWGPEPVEEFVPERFTEERVAARHPCAYIPFGAGPRNCIGMRFSILEQKITIARLLRNYYIEPCSKTIEKLSVGTSAIYAPKSSVHLKVTPRD